MKRFLALTTLLVLSATGCMASQEKSSTATPSREPFTSRVLTTGLADP